MNTEFEVTLVWLNQHCTARGGYRREQLTLIGVEWPPKPGWKGRVIGLRVPDASRARFEKIAANSRQGGQP